MFGRLISLFAYCVMGLIALTLVTCVLYTLNGTPEKALALCMDIVRSLNAIAQFIVVAVQFIVTH